MTSDSRKLREAIRLWSLYVTEDAADRMKQEARQAAPYKTGKLQNSIKTKPTLIRGNVNKTGLTVSVIQGATTSKGAVPHPIYPKRPGGRLVFFWEKKGRWVSLRMVNHPGNIGSGWWPKVHRRRWSRSLRSAAIARPRLPSR